MESVLLHMNGGDGQASYAQNSLLQRKIITMTKPIRDETIRKMIHQSFPTATCLTVADLGCSSGPNTLTMIRETVGTIYEIRRELVNIQVFLNDLPGNDFNSIFDKWPSFKKEVKAEIGDGVGEYFVHGTPGSFYDRLFESRSLHFVHSSYSLHWLSRVPEDLGKSNKSNILVSSGSPSSVIVAYYKQFQADFTAFLRCRSEELMNGGCMVLTLLGRSDDPSVKGSVKVYAQGLVEEEAVDTFNVPVYTPSPSEIEMEIKKEGSFRINKLQVSELDWGLAGTHASDEAESVTCMIRAVVEPILAHHFGQGLMEEVFTTYNKFIGDCMAKQRSFLTSVTISLTKKI
ncbi:hypothetical protein V2J09_005906 [Rumex salicifolius]